MDPTLEPLPSYLFVIRLWVAGTGNGTDGWRGQVRYVQSGETRYFRDWPALVNFLQEMLPAQANQEHG